MTPQSEPRKISLRSTIGMNYDDVMAWKGRYIAIIGSRASKKSYTIAYKILFGMMAMPYANALIVRKTNESHRSTTFTQFQKCINNLGLNDYWKINSTTMDITYKPTGQVIIFRGADDPYKLSSLQVVHGVLCWAWFEEAYQFNNETVFDQIDQSIRGKMPNGYFPQIVLTLNPWNKNHWIKRRFFDHPDSETLAKQVNYMMNEFLSEKDLKFFEDMKIRSPRMYQVAGLGNWGVSEGLIFTDWEERDFDITEITHRQSIRLLWGLDFGYSNDPTALIASAIDTEARMIYVYDEWLKLRQTNKDIADEIKRRGYQNERIVCDSAEPASIAELMHLFDIQGATPCLKGPGSLEFGIQMLQQYHIVIHPRCTNVITEFEVYAYEEDKMGNITNRPMDAMNHCLVPGTMVWTARGDMPIEDVKAGDMVMTHLGWRAVTASGITRFDADVYTMTLEDGTSLTGTGDHPIATTDGLMYLKDVTDGVSVILCQGATQTSKAKQSSMTESNSIAIQNRITHRIGTTSSTIPCGCTATCGNMSAGQSPKGTISITSTAIRGTMTYQTSNAYPRKSTPKGIPGRMKGAHAKRTSCAISTAQLKRVAGNGTHRTKATNGTFSRAIGFGMPSQCARGYARFAERNSITRKSGCRNFVQTIANPELEERRGSITRRAFVDYVARNSRSTDILGRNVAPVRVLSVYPSGKAEKVYDLTVDDAHDFYANGILVLNCVDALRYSVMDLLYGDGGGFYGATSEDLYDPSKADEIKEKGKERYVFRRKYIPVGCYRFVPVG